MDHVIEESMKVYNGTSAENILIFHAGLSQWWEEDAQKHTRTEAQGRKTKVVGDSPELCRGLDTTMG